MQTLGGAHEGASSGSHEGETCMPFEGLGLVAVPPYGNHPAPTSAATPPALHPSLLWSPEEQAVLQAELQKWGGANSMERCVLVAAALPRKTARDVALRVRWMSLQEAELASQQPTRKSSRQPKESARRAQAHSHAQFYASSFSRHASPEGSDGEGSAADLETLHGHMQQPGSARGRHGSSATNNGFKEGRSMGGNNGSSCCVDGGQHLAEEAAAVEAGTAIISSLMDRNYSILAAFKANMAECKVVENTELLIKYRDNLVAALENMNALPGTMSHMPPLPIQPNLELAARFLPPVKPPCWAGHPASFHHQGSMGMQSGVSMTAMGAHGMMHHPSPENDASNSQAMLCAPALSDPMLSNSSGPHMAAFEPLLPPPPPPPDHSMAPPGGGFMPQPQQHVAAYPQHAGQGAAFGAPVEHAHSEAHGASGSGAPAGALGSGQGMPQQQQGGGGEAGEAHAEAHYRHVAASGPSPSPLDTLAGSPAQQPVAPTACAPMHGAHGTALPPENELAAVFASGPPLEGAPIPPPSPLHHCSSSMAGGEGEAGGGAGGGHAAADSTAEGTMALDRGGVPAVQLKLEVPTSATALPGCKQEGTLCVAQPINDV